MSKNSKIEWTDHTWNPWIGCTKVGPGCDHCYAEAFDRRFAVSGHAMHWGTGKARRRTSEANWRLPVRWNAQAEKLGIRYRVFCASLADVFDNEVPETWRWDLFRMIDATPHIDWLLLTKRVGNARAMLNSAASAVLGDFVGAMAWEAKPWPNVWLGATIVDQEEADRDIPKLLRIPAAKRFLSCEPLLGPLQLWRLKSLDYVESAEGAEVYPLRGMYAVPDCDWPGPKLDWLIVGGESGPGARPMHPDHVRSLRDQCRAAGVPFFFKQWGEWLPGQNKEHPHANGRKVAHHQDGSWGATDTKVNATNYVTWDAAGSMRHGSLLNDTSGFRAHFWAERVGKKAAGRLLDGRIWDEVPA